MIKKGKLKRNSLFLILFVFASNLFATIYRGTLDVYVADNFVSGKSETTYRLISGENTYLLKFKHHEKINKLNLLSGDKVKVEGDIQSKVRGMDVLEVNKLEKTKLQGKKLFAETGERHALTLLVDFEDKKASASTSIDNVRKLMYTNEKSMRNNYLTSSFSQLDFIPDTNGDGQDDIYQVNLNYSAGNVCEVYKWRDDAKAAAEALGVDLSFYRYFVIVLPRNVSCGWGGLGNLGCGNACTSWIKSNGWDLVYAHELGHNLGMHHAATDPDNNGTVNSEYGDHSGIMGNGGYRQVNAPHRDQLGWYEAYPKNIIKIKKSKTINLFSLEKNPNIDLVGSQIIKFAKPTHNTNYYLSYRTNTGIFGMSTKYDKKVSVHTHKGGRVKTLFVKALDLKEKFFDPENGIQLTVRDINDDFAKVKVGIGEKCRFAKAPCILKPNSSFSDLGGKNTYFVIDVPENTATLTFTTEPTVETEDIKLLVKYGSKPRDNSNDDCISDTLGNYESCVFNSPQAGKWYVRIRSGEKYDGIKLSNSLE